MILLFLSNFSTHLFDTTTATTAATGRVSMQQQQQQQQRGSGGGPVKSPHLMSDISLQDLVRSVTSGTAG